jgi:hypothetical protein
VAPPCCPEGVAEIAEPEPLEIKVCDPTFLGFGNLTLFSNGGKMEIIIKKLWPAASRQKEQDGKPRPRLEFAARACHN